MNEELSNLVNQFSEILKEKNVDLNSVLSSSEDSQSQNDDTLNFDINTIIKIKSIMDEMNQNNSSRNNLLKSLKPFLRKEKQEKMDEYIKYANLLNLLELLNNGGDKNHTTK